MRIDKQMLYKNSKYDMEKFLTAYIFLRLIIYWDR